MKLAKLFNLIYCYQKNYFPHSQTSTSRTIASFTPHTSSTPPTSTPSHHSFLPRGCSPLPDIFTGLSFYLHKQDPQLTSTLTRYIIAYDGNIFNNITMETTHILCEAEDSSVELQVSTCKVRQLYTQRVGKVLSQGEASHAVVGISYIHVVCCIVRNLHV